MYLTGDKFIDSHDDDDDMMAELKLCHYRAASARACNIAVAIDDDDDGRAAVEDLRVKLMMKNVQATSQLQLKTKLKLSYTFFGNNGNLINSHQLGYLRVCLAQLVRSFAIRIMLTNVCRTFGLQILEPTILTH